MARARRVGPGIRAVGASLDPLRHRAWGLPVHRENDVGPGPRDLLLGRDRRHLARADPADDAAHAGVAPLLGHARREERSRLLGRVPGARDRDDREPGRARPRALLRLLGSDARPDVLHHRHLGRRAAHLRRDEVLPLHDGGKPADVPRDPLPGGSPPRADGRVVVSAGGPDAPGSHRLDAGAPLLRLRARLRHQGAGLSAAHVAAGRAHRGADGGVDHPRGRAAEARRVRLSAFRAAALPRRRDALRALARCARDHRRDLRRVRRLCAEGHEAARGVLLGVPPGTRGRRHRGLHGDGPLRRDSPDGQPRPFDGGALPSGRRPLRAAPHARDLGVRRDRRHRPRHNRALPRRDAVVHRPAGIERLRGRVPDSRRDLDFAAPVVVGRGGDRRHPLGGLHAVARPAGLLEPADARGEPRDPGDPQERARRRVGARRPDDLDRRPAQRRPLPPRSVRRSRPRVGRPTLGRGCLAP